MVILRLIIVMLFTKIKGKKRFTAPRTKSAEDKKTRRTPVKFNYTRHTNRRAGIFTGQAQRKEKRDIAGPPKDASGKPARWFVWRVRRGLGQDVFPLNYLLINLSSLSDRSKSRLSSILYCSKAESLSFDEL